MTEFQAVQCFQCSQYQVIHKRKDGKFNCKICGSKQSVRKVFARCNKAAEVRKLVQQLNLVRGTAEEQYNDFLVRPGTPNGRDKQETHELCHDALDNGRNESGMSSKWAAYDAIVRSEGLQTSRESIVRKPDDTESVGNGNEGPEYVTTLQDRFVRKLRGKQNVTTTASNASNQTSETMNWRTQLFSPESRETDAYCGIQNRRPSKRLRRNLKNAANVAPVKLRDGPGCVEAVGIFANPKTRTRRKLDSDDFEEVTFTGLGEDEVVHDETCI